MTDRDDRDRKVRDLVRGRELTERRRLGERTLRRVGDRGWERPNVFVSGKLYKRHGVRDPWDPSAGPEDPVKMGPVSLRLGEERRQPAPHLRPKEPKAKKQADPLSKWRRPASAPRPAPAPAPRSAPRPAPKAQAAPPAPPAADPTAFVPTPDRVERGMFRNKVKRGLKVPIPVRPELRKQADAPDDRVVARAPDRKPLGPAPARPAVQRTPRSRAGRVMFRKDAPPVDLGGPEVVEAAPAPAAPSPVEAAPLAPLEVLGEPAAPAPAPAVDRRPPGGPMGLDDLFGGMPEGRVRMRRRKPAPEPPEES